jgi:hypothetical protein
MQWSLISAVNNQEVLTRALLNSADVNSASEVILERGHRNAASAYNAAIEKAKTDLVVFAHQDMYFPDGWFASVSRAIEHLDQSDARWGVLGVWGVAPSGQCIGNMYCAGLREKLGSPFTGAIEVRSLDEVVLIIRKSSGLRFDAQLPGFHMYGTDICLEAARRGLKSFVVSAFCIHNTNGYKLLPLQFWLGYWFMRRKWKTQLPISTTCTQITFGCWPMFKWNLLRAANLMLGRHKPPTRVEDPRGLYRDLVNRGLVSVSLG